jgi:hypothetical protein
MSTDTTNDIAEFLISRRAKITPEQVALPTYGRRRVRGLRREEVASLAGASIDYYRRLERRARSASDVVEDEVIGHPHRRLLHADHAQRH